jgi:hypothetical protein
MARQDWTYIQISKQMAEVLDKFLKTDIANNIQSVIRINSLDILSYGSSKTIKKYGLLVTRKDR